jgi:hypothetical protein
VYWTIGAPIEQTVIINRCRTEDSYEVRSANDDTRFPAFVMATASLVKARMRDAGESDQRDRDRGRTRRLDRLSLGEVG